MGGSSGILPEAPEGARLRFEQALCGWQRSHERTAGQQVRCAAYLPTSRICGGALNTIHFVSRDRLCNLR